MPRNSTGNYTLPLPPVVSGELIEATWANTTLDDIGQALTDSLDRYGRGGMLASFLFADGTESNPGAAWANAPGTGFFRDSTHLGFSWNGAEVFSYNANGLNGTLGTVTVAQLLNIVQGASLTFKSNEDTAAWRFDIDTAENLYLYNNTLARAPLTLRADGEVTVDGTLEIAYGANRFLRYQGAGDVPAWYIGLFVNSEAVETFQIYNADTGTIALQFNPSDNRITFGGTTAYPNNIASRYVDSTGADRWLLGKGSGTDDRFVLYNLVAGVDVFAADATTNKLIIPGEVQTSGTVSLTKDGSGNTDMIVWSYGGQSRLNMKSIGGWAGFEWHMPTVSFMGVYQVSDGSLRWLAGQDIGLPIMSFHPTGQIRAKSFLAAATPG